VGQNDRAGAELQPGEKVWYAGKEALFVAYHGTSAARIRFPDTGVESAVRVSKLGRTRRESLDLALVSGR
jgi:hypothetical protein